MDNQRRATATTAETRLVEAASAKGLADPRPAYRERLRALRQEHPAAFERAVAHYEQTVLPALGQTDPLAVWIEYGRFLGGLTADGIVMAIDGSGRATTLAPGADVNAQVPLVLFIPTENAAGVLPLLEPVSPTPAQKAAINLLVDRKLALG